ncbi:hypothetical protein TRVL_06593 [Trypanosoma vivax]|nr:hypothetical protein TRVL_06593 [Trypanosoma vivax]
MHLRTLAWRASAPSCRYNCQQRLHCTLALLSRPTRTSFDVPSSSAGSSLASNAFCGPLVSFFCADDLLHVRPNAPMQCRQALCSPPVSSFLVFYLPAPDVRSVPQNSLAASLFLVAGSTALPARVPSRARATRRHCSKFPLPNAGLRASPKSLSLPPALSFSVSVSPSWSFPDPRAHNLLFVVAALRDACDPPRSVPSHTPAPSLC